MNFDLSQVPFSRFGSYLAVSRLADRPKRPAGLYLRTVHGAAQQPEIFRLELVHDGASVPFEEIASPEILRLRADAGEVEICISASGRSFRIRGRGVGMRLVVARVDSWAYAFPVAEGVWRINNFSTRSEYLLRRCRGTVRVDSVWDKISAPKGVTIEITGDNWEISLEEFVAAPSDDCHTCPFMDDVQSAREDFVAFRKSQLRVPAKYSAAADLAAYINWSAVVAPAGHLKRPAMFMSKNHMNHVWSWDHCFNAMALAKADPDLAWDQFMIFADSQHPTGQFADCIDDAVAIWNFCKPPIHGWTLRKLMAANRAIDTKRLKEAYRPLCRWTEWWLAHRDDDRDGIPQYNHGNDSGWDNATVFALGPNVESPELAAFLVIQMETLADVAEKIGKKPDAPRWRQRAEDLLQKLINHSWRDRKFVAPRSGDHAVAEGDCLLPYETLILGKRLPADMRRRMIESLTQPGRFLTEFGLATESPKSPFHKPDGYWRGPIWAPSTMIMVEALAACGEKKLAATIAQRFCDLCAKSGFAENFDAQTGQGLRDRAYTWTSSVFLLLANQYPSRV